MKFCVENPNISNRLAPKNFKELVTFVEFVKENPNSIYVQISGYGSEVVEALAKHFGTNYIDHYQNSDINPFTIIYIDQEGNVGSVGINERSKIIIYAKRANHNHYQGAHS